MPQLIPDEATVQLKEPSEERRFSFSNAFRSDTTHLFINFHFDALFIADSRSCDSFNQKFLLFWTRIEYFTFREN